jgi:hypothetical protein
MPATFRFPPFVISDDLELHVSRFKDGDTGELVDFPISTLGDDGLELVYDLSGSTWKSVVLDLQATLPIPALQDVLPATTDVKRDTVLTVSVICPATKVRKVVELESGKARGQWSGRLELRREWVRNVVTLVPRLVRRADVPQQVQTDGLARRRHAIVAEGRGVKLRVDTTDSPFRGGLDVRWEDFRSSDDIWRRDHSNEIFSLSLDTSTGEPILWLNARYTKLRAALHSKAEGGADAMLKKMAIALIGQATWYQFFLAAASEVRIDAEIEGVVQPGGWKGAVLAQLLPRLYSDSTESERPRRLAEDLRSEGAAGTLAMRLGSALQAQLGTTQLTIEAIRAGERQWGE